MRLTRTSANLLVRLSSKQLSTKTIPKPPPPLFKPHQTTKSHIDIMEAQQVPKTCKVILSDTIAKKLLSEVRETLAKIQGPDASKPTLAAFLATDDPSALQYAEWSKKTCEEK